MDDVLPVLDLVFQDLPDGGIRIIHEETGIRVDGDDRQAALDAFFEAVVKQGYEIYTFGGEVSIRKKR